MRTVLLPTLVVLGLALPGCSGFGIGVRQDKEDAAAATRALAGRVTGARFPARTMLDEGWTRLWVFRGGVSTQGIEDRIGIPFPRSGEDTPAGQRYLVFDDGKAVVSSFSLTPPPRVDPGCLLAERRPLGPATPLELLPPGGAGAPGKARLTPVAAAARCR